MADIFSPLRKTIGVTHPSELASDALAKHINAQREARGFPPHDAEEYLINAINDAKGIEERTEKEVKALEMEINLKDARIKEIKKTDDYDREDIKSIEREIERLRKDIMALKAKASEAPIKAAEAKEKLKTLRAWYKENPVPQELMYPPTGVVPKVAQLDRSEWSV